MTTGDTEATPVDEVLVGNLIQRVVPAFNAHDADGFVAVMTEDVVFEHSAAPAPMHGRAEVSAFYTNNVWKAFPDVTMELMDGPFFHPHAPRISFNWFATGTHTGPLDPAGLAPTGKRVEFDVREIAEIRNGLVSRIRLVVDMADVNRQLGMLPAPGSHGERAMAMMQRLQMKLSRITSLRQRREAIVNQHAEAENRHDVEATIATFHHPRYEVNGVPSDGEEAVRELLQGMINGLPDLHAEIGKMRHADDAVFGGAYDENP